MTKIAHFGPIFGPKKSISVNNTGCSKNNHAGTELSGRIQPRTTPPRIRSRVINLDRNRKQNVGSALTPTPVERDYRKVSSLTTRIGCVSIRQLTPTQPRRVATEPRGPIYTLTHIVNACAHSEHRVRFTY